MTGRGRKSDWKRLDESDVRVRPGKGSRPRTMAELLERWLEWRPTVRPVAPTTVSSYRAAMDRYILPAYGRLDQATRRLAASVREVCRTPSDASRK